MTRHIFALTAAVLLAGCPGEEPLETDDTDDTDAGETDDTEPMDVFDGDNIAVVWDADSVDTTLTGTDAQGFWLGLAETDSDNGWYGEDCLNGTGDYAYCHYFTGLTGSLTYVDAPGEVVEGSTTLLDDLLAFDADTGDLRITYLLQLDHGDSTVDCYVWGHDPSYYASEGCTEL